MARPTKLTHEVQERICTAIREGNTLEIAAKLSGVSYSTFRSWEQRGREAEEHGADPESGPEAAFVQFLQATTRARTEFEAAAVASIGKAGQGDWRALAWLLERRFPERWGRRDKMQLTGAEEGAVQVRVYLPDNGRDPQAEVEDAGG